MNLYLVKCEGCLGVQDFESPHESWAFHTFEDFEQAWAMAYATPGTEVLRWADKDPLRGNSTQVVAKSAVIR